MTALRLAEAARLLGGTARGANVNLTAFAIDSRKLRPGECFIALRGPNFDGHDFVAAAAAGGACAALVSRWLDTPLPQLRVADPEQALGQLGQYWRSRFQGPVVALTGSNGKTTVKEMTAAVLRQRGSVLATQGNLNNHIGLPLTLTRLDDSYRYAVIEMGANHPSEIAYLTHLGQPDVALITNAGPAHLEGFGDIQGVARAKGEIYQGLSASGVALINADDAYADYWRGLNGGRRIIDFGIDRPAALRGAVLSVNPNRFRLTVADDSIEIDLPLPGRHSVYNALAAAAAGHTLGVPLTDICHALQGMDAVAGRLQRLAGVHGSTLLNDTYNANPASLAAALQVLGTLAGRKWLVLGDMAELGMGAAEMHTDLGRQAHAVAERLYALGPHSRAAVAVFGEGAKHFADMETLIDALRADLQAHADAPPTLLVKGSRSMRMERVAQALGVMAEASSKGVAAAC